MGEHQLKRPVHPHRPPRIHFCCSWLEQQKWIQRSLFNVKCGTHPPVSACHTTKWSITMTTLAKQEQNWIAYDLRATINPGAAPSGRVIYGLENPNAFVPAKQDTYVLPAFGGDILAIMPGEPYIYVYGLW